jgi:alcohol dehydrogenase class IV
MPFEFATAARIIFGLGALREAGPAATELCPGGCVLVITGASAGRAAPLLADLEARGLRPTLFQVATEPTLDVARAGAKLARDAGCELVIGLGGGSALDAGKAIAALAANPGDPLDYVEVIGRGQALTEIPLPYIAIPTTAGTGTEVTRNAVLASPEHQVKVSLRSPRMLPRLAIVDPELTYSLPPDETASTGLDALTQLLEPFTCNRPNPLTDAVCREGMQHVARSLRRAFAQGQDSAAREDMSIASLFGGLALANARLGAVHGFAAPIGGLFDAPHGAVCARLLPVVVSMNLRALRARAPESPTLLRYAEAARLLTGDGQATADDGVAWLEALAADLQIRPLRAYGLQPADFPALVEKAAVASSMQGNAVKLTPDELRDILEQAV